METTLKIDVSSVQIFLTLGGIRHEERNARSTKLGMLLTSFALYAPCKSSNTLPSATFFGRPSRNLGFEV
jgi:hypothetical protein